jgi:hypothetical protein
MLKRALISLECVFQLQVKVYPMHVIQCCQCLWIVYSWLSGFSNVYQNGAIINCKWAKTQTTGGGLVSLTCRVIWMHVPFHSKFQKWRQFHLFTTHAHRRVQEKVNSTQVCKLWLRTKGAIKWFVYNYVMFLKYLCGIFCICVQFDIFLCAFSQKNLTLIDFKTKFLKVKMCEWHFFLTTRQHGKRSGCVTSCERQRYSFITETAD